MKGTVVARRYARALFNIGAADGKADKYGQALAEMAALFRDDPRIPEVLDSPLFDREFREKILQMLISEMDQEWEAFRNFISLLYDKRRLGILDQIAESYSELADQEAGRLSADVVSAAPLDEAIVKHIADALAARLGSRVSVRPAVNPSLGAGFRAQVGSLVIDGSLSGLLGRLKETLTQGKG